MANTAQQIKNALGIRGNKKLSLQAILDDCYEMGGDALPWSVREAAYGIAYAIQTCRISGKVELAIKAMRPAAIANLIGDLADCNIGNEKVAGRLIKLYA